MRLSKIKINFVPSNSYLNRWCVLISCLMLSMSAVIIILTLFILLIFYNRYTTSQKDVSNILLYYDSLYLQNKKLVTLLDNVDTVNDCSSWQVMERFCAERNLTWSKLITTLEQAIVNNVRISSIARGTFIDKKNIVKLVGQAYSRKDELVFLNNLCNNQFFREVLVESETIYQDGSTAFIYRLNVIFK